MPLQRMVSGGQTGVDRAALDTAIRLNISHGGWCPRGRLAEDGPIDGRYDLTETASSQYPVRTEQNVLDSDATLILYQGEIYGGTLLTARLAKKHERPLLMLDLGEGDSAEATDMNLGELCRWFRVHAISTLNVAGPRESSSPGVGQRATDFLLQAAPRLVAASA